MSASPSTSHEPNTKSPLASAHQATAHSVPPPPAAAAAAAAAPVKKPTPSAPKPSNVFSSDGSYLARFAASRKPATADQDAQQKLKEQEAALKRKQAADDRFKNRGKKRTSTDESSSPGGDKKAKSSSSSSLDSKVTQGMSSAYMREVAEINRTQGLREEGVGVRPVMK